MMGELPASRKGIIITIEASNRESGASLVRRFDFLRQKYENGFQNQGSWQPSQVKNK
jgi:hypothetical protein